MSTTKQLVQDLFAALEGSTIDDPNRARSAPTTPPPPEFLARFGELLRRTGEIDGVACSIHAHGRGFVMRGYREGYCVVIGEMVVDDGQGDVDPVQLEQATVLYELVPMPPETRLGEDGEHETVHLIRGMSRAVEADQFFDPLFFARWRVARVEVGNRQPGGADDCEGAACHLNGRG